MVNKGGGIAVLAKGVRWLTISRAIFINRENDNCLQMAGSVLALSVKRAALF